MFAVRYVRCANRLPCVCQKRRDVFGCCAELLDEVRSRGVAELDHVLGQGHKVGVGVVLHLVCVGDDAVGQGAADAFAGGFSVDPDRRRYAHLQRVEEVRFHNLVAALSQEVSPVHSLCLSVVADARFQIADVLYVIRKIEVNADLLLEHQRSGLESDFRIVILIQSKVTVQLRSFRSRPALLLFRQILVDQVRGVVAEEGLRRRAVVQQVDQQRAHLRVVAVVAQHGVRVGQHAVFNGIALAELAVLRRVQRRGDLAAHLRRVNAGEGVDAVGIAALGLFREDVHGLFLDAGHFPVGVIDLLGEDHVGIAVAFEDGVQNVEVDRDVALERQARGLELEVRVGNGTGGGENGVLAAQLRVAAGAVDHGVVAALSSFGGLDAVFFDGRAGVVAQGVHSGMLTAQLCTADGAVDDSIVAAVFRTCRFDFIFNPILAFGVTVCRNFICCILITAASASIGCKSKFCTSRLCDDRLIIMAERSCRNGFKFDGQFRIGVILAVVFSGFCCCALYADVICDVALRSASCVNRLMIIRRVCLFCSDNGCIYSVSTCCRQAVDIDSSLT